MEGMHQGFPGMVATLRRYLYWPTMYEDAKKYCQNCRLCQLTKQGNRDKYRIITSVPAPQYVFQVVYMDLVHISINEASTSHAGHTHILTMCDRLSRFCRLIPISLSLTPEEKKSLGQLERQAQSLKHKAETTFNETNRLRNLDEHAAVQSQLATLSTKRASVIVGEHFLKEIILRLHKVPQIIVTDNGSEFNNALLKHLTRTLGIKLRFITALNPRANFVERVHRSLKAMLKASINAYVFKDIKNWHRYIPYIEHRLNAYKPKDQEYSPAQIVLGQTQDLLAAGLRTDTLSPSQALNAPSSSENQALTDYAKELISFQTYVEEWLSAQTLRRQEVQNARFNRQQKYHEYVKGDRVAIYNKRIGNRATGELPTKLILQWSGPHTILEKKGPQLYKVQLNGSNSVTTVTTDRLKPLSRELMMPAKPQTIWEPTFPMSGEDLFLVQGDHVIMLELPDYLISSRGRTKIESSPFYLAEFIQYSDDKALFLIKGYRPRTYDDVGPYNSQYHQAWRLTDSASRRAKRDAAWVVFSTTNPKPSQYEPVKILAQCGSLLPLYGFQLTKDNRIPSKMQANIKTLLAHRELTIS